MNFRAIRAIVRKDLKVVFQSRGVILPIVIVPLIMLVILPTLAAVALTLAGDSKVSLNGLDSFIANMPESLRSELSGYNETQTIVFLALVYFLAPMYLIIPLMVASVIAADSFAGEKERKTLEALLYTPTTDRELFFAKLFSAWVPAIAVAIFGFLIYSLVANAAAWPVMGKVFFPNPMWLVLAFWVAPAVAGLGLGVTVLVSTRVGTFQEAYQMGGMIVLPIIMLAVGQGSGVMYFSTWLVVLLGLVFWTLDAIILWFGSKTFRRSELIARA